MSSERLAPILRYPGAKWRIADWIVAHLPAHTSYLEPFAGSLAVFCRKRRSPLETLGDRDARIVNLFRVCRERPGELAAAVALTPWARAEHAACWAEPASGDALEDARRLLVRAWQNHGSRSQRGGGWRHYTTLPTPPAGPPDTLGMINPVRQWQRLPARILAVAARLQDAQLECRPALELIARFARPEVLIYADPPYPRATRGERADRHYLHELTDDEHRALLDALEAHPGPVLLSGYRCALYQERLGAWQCVTKGTLAEGNRPREEALWLNPVAVARLTAWQPRLPLPGVADERYAATMLLE